MSFWECKNIYGKWIFLFIYMFLFNAFHALTNKGIILTTLIAHHSCFNKKLISNDSKIELIENNWINIT